MLVDDKTHKRAIITKYIVLKDFEPDPDKVCVKLGSKEYEELKKRLKRHIVEQSEDETYDPENILGILDEFGVNIIE